MSHIYDNWERLVAAVLKQQQFWELCHAHSRSPSILSEASDFSSSFRSSYENQDDDEKFEYWGWVYHLGVNSIGHEYCHLRFLFIRGKYVEMYKRDPQEHPGIKPIRRGVLGLLLMVEELGRRKVNIGDVYVLRFYNRLDETKKGEIACATAGDARTWMEAFDHAKQQVEYELSKGASVRNKLNMDDDFGRINLEGHWSRVRRRAYSLKKLVKIGQGPVMRKASNANGRLDAYFDADSGDAIGAHEWKCICTINGVRIFEDVANSQSGKGILVKAVGVVDASADAVFEVLLSIDPRIRYEWDTLTGDLELVDSINGHFDVVYGTFDPHELTWRPSKRDFVFSRQWFRGQDGTYTILQFPSLHKKRPPRSGYKRTKINTSTWEICNLSTPISVKCLVTQTLEMNHKSWLKWRKKHRHEFEKSVVPHALLAQVSGLKEYVGANPTLTPVTSATTIIESKVTDAISGSNSEVEESEPSDEFYDAIAADSITHPPQNMSITRCRE